MLMQEIEKRAKTNDDFSTLLSDCYECYYEQRRALLHGMVTKTVEDLCTEHGNNLPALVRAGCAYIARMCANEYQLYQHFFYTVDSGLDFFLEGLANVLYDACRPLFIHNVTTIDALVELCSVLRVEAVDSTGPEMAAFAAVAEQMLQDVQQRLCYLTQNYVESSIAGFVPSAADLDYPNKLKKGNNGSQNNAAEIGAGNEDAASTPADVINPGWYPTVTRSLLLLSKLYRSVDRQAFQDLSLEIVQACLSSLDAAHASLVAKKDKQHGRLFMILHLIVIREQLAPFDDIEFSRVERYLDIVGFLSSLKGATADLYERRTTILSDATTTLFNFLQRTTPQVLETTKDTAVDLEKTLKQYCLDFINEASRAAAANLNSFNVMVDALPEASRAQLSTHPSAVPAKVRELVLTATTALQKEVATMPILASQYLDKKTVNVLVGKIQAHALSAFKRFHDIVSANYSEADLAMINLPTFEAVHELMTTPPKAEPVRQLEPEHAPQELTPQPPAIAPAATASDTPVLETTPTVAEVTEVVSFEVESESVELT